jgi:hypothetical protein
MNFSIRGTIREFVAPERILRCSKGMWRSCIAELRRRSGGAHESGAFLLGCTVGQERRVLHICYYDDLDPTAYDSGVCQLSGTAFAQLWAICREHKLNVVGDIHTHPGQAWQSPTDRVNPMVARAGHLALIIPHYARTRFALSEIGFYEYLGNHQWRDFSGRIARKKIYLGIFA